jgi:DNA polymerase-4
VTDAITAGHILAKRASISGHESGPSKRDHSGGHAMRGQRVWKPVGPVRKNAEIERLYLELASFNERIQELEKQHPEASKIDALRAPARKRAACTLVIYRSGRSAVRQGSANRLDSMFFVCSSARGNVKRAVGMDAPATILHADLDAFYASVEQLLDPSLCGKPIAVGSGVVLAASYEAKAFGVSGGMPGRRARELCPHLIFVEGHFEEYQRLGDAAIGVLDDFTPLVERISIDEAFADVAGCTHLFGTPVEIASAVRHRVRTELGLPISIGIARTKHLAKIASQVAKPDGLVVVEPDTELTFLHDLPVELMWGVGPATKARLTEIGVHTIGHLTKMPGASLQRVLGHAAAEKLTALARNRDARRLRPYRRSQSAGAQSALGKKPAHEKVFRPALRRLADRIATRLRASCRPGRTVSVRVRFADLRSATRSVTLDAPLSATVILAEIAEELVTKLLADHPEEKTISLLAISVSRLETCWDMQLELPLGLEDEDHRPGTKLALARGSADRAMDKIRTRFGWQAVGYGSVVLGDTRSVPDAFRELAERDL